MSENPGTSEQFDSTSASNLPIEVVVRIMLYLSSTSRRAMGSVNRTWRGAYLMHRHLEQEVLTIDKQNSADVLRMLLKSKRPFYHLVFREMKIVYIESLWKLHGPHARTIVLEYCDFNESTLVTILTHCKKLRSLHISCCTWKGWKPKPHPRFSFKLQLPELRELILCRNGSISDPVLRKLIAMCPNLESLDLSNCWITSNSHRSNEQTLKSLSIEELIFILGPRICKLKHLGLNQYMIDQGQMSFFFTSDKLKLITLKLTNCLNVTPISPMIALCQRDLRVLDVSECRTFNDENIELICSNLKKLKVLDVHNCPLLTSTAGRHIGRLLELQKLNISGTLIDPLSMFPRDEQENVLPPLNPKLLELSIRSMDVSVEAMRAICSHYLELQVLDMDDSVGSLDIAAIKMITENLINLRSLNINKRVWVCLPKTVVQQVKKQKVRTIVIYYCPAKLQREQTQPVHFNEQITFAALQNLRTLDLNGYYELTDAMLENAINIPTLKSLNLMACPQITHRGLAPVTKNCPNIVELKLMGCIEMDDQAVAEIAKNLRELSRLKLVGCPNITDFAIELLRVHSYNLRFLDLRYCVSISAEALQTVSGTMKVWHTTETMMVKEVDRVRNAPPVPTLVCPSECYMSPWENILEKSMYFRFKGLQLRGVRSFSLLGPL